MYTVSDTGAGRVSIVLTNLLISSSTNKSVVIKNISAVKPTSFQEEGKEMRAEGHRFKPPQKSTLDKTVC